ncbi:MAG: hypothetical protein WCI49_05185 [Ferruginibacter sp.]
MIPIIISCHNYYKAAPATGLNSTEKAVLADSLKLQKRYFVLRSGKQAFYMNNVVLSEDKKSLTCSLEVLPEIHQFHLAKGRGGKMRYRKNDSDEKLVLNEVHFYIPTDSSTAVGAYSLQLDKVEKIEVLEKDGPRTRSSYIIGAIGYTIGSLAVVAIIIAATKSSCPFVSAYDGNNFLLQGEIYGGAIYPQLARHDYMPLRMTPLPDGSLQVKISNELHERQYTDIAELWVITHNKNSRVFADEKGNLFSISKPQSLTSATLNEKQDVTEALKKEGDNNLLHMDDTTVNASNEVVIQFNKPATATKAKLILSLKNSYFLDLLYGELAKGFGKYYGTYIKQQQRKPAAELLQWTKDQRIPLEVAVQTNSGWKKITSIPTIGPLATRNMMLPIDLSGIKGPVTAIKLSSGFMFWEIDYAAIDYSEDEPFTIEKITAAKASDELGKNILPDLQNEDGQYLAQPEIGNMATMVYNTAPLTDQSKTRSYILHTKGYYEHIRDFKNAPDFGFLKQFKNPGAFPQFGMRLYKKISAQNLTSLASTN